MTNKLTVVVSQGRTAQPSREKLQRDLADALRQWPNLQVTTLPHLYDLAPDGPGMDYLRSVEGDMIVFSWLYPRAAFWVLDANGIRGRMGPTSFFPDEELPPAPANPASAAGLPSQQDRSDGAATGRPDRTIWCLDLRTHDQPEPMLEEVGRIARESTGEPVVALGRHKAAAAGRTTGVEESTRQRWYPVIDYSRCGNCLECLNFCLFGVFGLDEFDHLVVEQPDACRDGCPACSRVCPSHAIIFPHCNNPAIAGDPEASDEAFHFDLTQLSGLGGAAELAAAERARALAEKARLEQSKADESEEQDDLDRLVDDLDEMDL